MDLTGISFVIAIVGIVLQVADAFPEHRGTRKAIVLLSLGVFIGVAVSSLLGAEYEVKGDFDSSYALLFALVGAFVIFGLLAVITTGEAAGWLTLGSAALFVIFAISLFLSKSDPRYTYSTDEVLILANNAERRGEIERAVERLEELRQRISNTAAHSHIQRRIDRLEAERAGQQVAGQNSPLSIDMVKDSERQKAK